MSERETILPQLRRFDGESTTPMTPQEIKRRWNEFHRQIRAMSGTPIRRIAGRILGEDTWRYHGARFVFRPMLQLWRRRRGVEARRVARVAATRSASIFPVNYRPRNVDYSIELGRLNFDPGDVAIVALDDAVNPADQITALNDTLNDTTATWLFLADSDLSEERRLFSAATLLAHATVDDDVVFADETGPNEFAPLLKSPSVGPHTLLSYNVIGRPALLRVATLFRVGGFAHDAGRAFEHDAYLRLSEARARFRHVPRVLPAGRPASSFDGTLLDGDTLRVVQGALVRRGWRGAVTPGALPGLVRWSLEAPSDAPSIDIIIPTRDRIDLVRRCIDSIEERTTYPNYDVIILDNDSVKQESLSYFDETKYAVIPCPGPFNYAKIVNRGVAHSSADYVVTLNNDTVVVTPDWLEQMLALASLPDVGIVGACLLDPDGRREHEGIVIAPYPQHLRTDSNYPHVDSLLLLTARRRGRDRRDPDGRAVAFWNSLGGMDERLKVVMNDVDLCLRSLMEDRYVVYTPYVQLFHHVRSSRGDLDPIDDRNRFIRRWDIFGSFRDPFFPESLLLLGEKIFYFLALTTSPERASGPCSLRW